MGRNVVLWSGGADSTHVLNHYAGVSSEDYPVIALSVSRHRYLSKMFLKAQDEARKRYLAWAEKKGYHIRHYQISMTGNFEFGVCKVPSSAQSVMWLSAIFHVVADGDDVLVGYIEKDGFWHFRYLFEEVFNAMCVLKGIAAKLKYPAEWHDKAKILELLKKDKVPNNCWFSCESTKNGKACGECYKCREITEAKQKLLKDKKGGDGVR